MGRWASFVARIVLGLLAMEVAWSSGAAAPAEAQVVRRTGFQPIDDAGFAIVEQFYVYDRSLPLASRTVESFDEDSVHVEKVVFTAFDGERVPGFLRLPLHGTSPRPCVLLLHGLNHSKAWWWDDERAHRLIRRLDRAGIATFAIDLRLHGERSAANDYQAPMYLTFENTLFVRNRNMIIESAVDGRRALDVLKSRAEIDSSRVAVVGYSMGGMIGLYLSALEPWLAGEVLCSVPSHVQLLPADHYHFAARSRVPTLFESGTQDWHTSAEDARVLLSLIRAEDKDLVLFESGHSLPDAYAERAADWLIRRLR